MLFLSGRACWRPRAPPDILQLCPEARAGSRAAGRLGRRAACGARIAGAGAASVLLRGACGKNESFGRLGVTSAMGRWRRREGEEGGRRGVGVVVEIAAGAAPLALATTSVVFTAAAAVSGDGGRTDGDMRRFRGRAGIGLDR